MHFAGKRLAYVDEASSVRLDSDRLKTLSAGQLMNTRSLRETGGPWTSHVTLIMGGNDTLRLNAADSGIMDRFVPILMELGPVKRDYGFMDRMRSQEVHDAVLWWALQGAVSYLRDGAGVEGLAMTERIAEARASYLSENDPLERWFDARVLISETPNPESRRNWQMFYDYAEYMRVRGQSQFALSDKGSKARLGNAGHPMTGEARQYRKSDGSRRKGPFFSTLALVGGGV